MKLEEIKIIKEILPISERIIGSEEYFQAAILIPLIKRGNEYSILFEKRAANIRQGGEVSLPGGEIEPSDGSPVFTAIRETSEELGLPKEKILVHSKLGTLVSQRGLIAHAFVGELLIDSLGEIKIEKSEVEKIFALPVSFFEENTPDEYNLNFEIHPYYLNKNGEKVELLPVEQLKLPQRYAKPWRGKNHKVLVYPAQKEVVWGLTARLIYEFVKILKEKRRVGKTP